ncbi:hypothetical protein MEA186_24407 [Mesorhizobium amorphae CCNWGS0123]|uniref:Uncharacterized protein n=1 Tax=Mesorhizobium amorphae CCNWGS0123 TaxID=1082933 RepID=G6YFX7_9HYPH|nr:hypothetical protein A6B35_30295 [Mesorhizobium amorphae CCNWGS0123]EHH09371.1 hypothetical protein MEA186_24407 [Mesorhizobium amorphae CCNWGS0123]
MPAGYLPWLGAHQPRSWLHRSLPIYAHFSAQWPEGMRLALERRSVDPRLAAQLQQHPTQISDAMAAR